MGFFKWIKSKCEPKHCKHTSQRHRKWVENDTPMIETQCADCGEQLDYGHVHGDTEEWATNGWVNT
jgi:hypothetical protein